MKMLKVYDNDDEDGQQTNFDQKSSLETWAQVSFKHKQVFIDYKTKKQVYAQSNKGMRANCDL